MVLRAACLNLAVAADWRGRRLAMPNTDQSPVHISAHAFTSGKAKVSRDTPAYLHAAVRTGNLGRLIGSRTGKAILGAARCAISTCWDYPNAFGCHRVRPHESPAIQQHVVSVTASDLGAVLLLFSAGGDAGRAHQTHLFVASARLGGNILL